MKKDWIYWTPRVLSILFVLFLMMFSLDIFDMNLGFWGVLLGLFMHNIPALILALFVWWAWKNDLVGVIVFAVAGLLYVIMIALNFSMNSGFNWNHLTWFLTISGPAFLVALFYYLNWKRKSKRKN